VTVAFWFIGERTVDVNGVRNQFHVFGNREGRSRFTVIITNKENSAIRDSYVTAAKRKNMVLGGHSLLYRELN
jgi:hypothetical protein